MAFPPVRFSPALGWMVATLTAYAVTGAAIRHVADSYGTHPFEIAFFRTAFGLLPLIAVLRVMGVPLLPERDRGAHLARGLCETGATLSWVLAVSLMPLATFSAINLTAIFFAMGAAVLFLGETIGRHRLTAILIGMVGAVIVLRPDATGITAGGAAALVNATCAGFSRALTRHLGRQGSAYSIVVSTMLIGFFPMLVAAAIVWTTPSLAELIWFVAIAAGGFIAQFCLAAAYRSAAVTELASFEFLQIPIGAAVGFAAFGQVPDVPSILGALVIVAAAIYSVRRERIKSGR